MRHVGGGGLLSILITVLIMGGLGALVISDVGSPLTIPTTLSVPTTGHSTTQTTQTPVSTAEQVACVRDANALSTALTDYQLINGITLGSESGVTVGEPATYSHGREAQELLNSPYLSSWPVDSGFALSFSTTHAGDIAVYVPATSRFPVLFQSETATTGCNAL